jgi:hypothetical protein
VRDDDLTSADRRCKSDRTVENEVRQPSDQELVLAAERLALGGVDDDDRPATAGGDRASLGGRREARASAAAETGCVELGDQVAGGCQTSVVGEMRVETERTARIEACEQPRSFTRHGFRERRRGSHSRSRPRQRRCLRSALSPVKAAPSGPTFGWTLM